MDILYEDDFLLIAVKASGILSEVSENAPSLPLLLKEQLSLAEAPHPVHRLDREVGGAMLLAKTSSAMAACSRIVADGLIKKEYLAVTEGIPASDKGCLSDLLLKSASQNKTFTVTRMRKGVKKACLSYCVLGYAEYEGQALSLISVTPHTGRTHQIRVQFASRRLPLTGDRKYGGKMKMPIGLFCRSLSFPHPYTNKQITCTAPLPQSLPFALSYQKGEKALALDQERTVFFDFRNTGDTLLSSERSASL